MGRRIVQAVMLAGLMALAWAGVARADTIVVTNNNDEGPGSLREDIGFVEAGGKVIVPASVGTIRLNSEIEIFQDVTIEGTGATRPVVDGQLNSRLFRIGNGAFVEISGMNLAEGKAVPAKGTFSALGGGILFESGELTLANDFIERNEADATTAGKEGQAVGGAIFTSLGASLTLDNTIVTDNRAVGGNEATDEALGGAIAARGELKIEGGEVKGNTAQGAKVEGGGIYFDSEKPALLQGVTVSGNLAQAYPGSAAKTILGGGLELEGPTTLLGVTVRANTASGDSATGEGGEVLGGGLQSRSPVTIVNSTFTANVASAQVKANGSSAGGAIAAGFKPMTIVNSTLAGNSVRAAGTSSLSRAGTLWTVLSTVRLENTIVAGGETSNGPQNCFLGMLGEIASAGGNIDSAQTCHLTAATDQSNTNPLLGPLAANGGPVETMALLPGSPAIDKGVATDCPATDARGVLRPGGAACDVGAFEVATPVASTEPAIEVRDDRATLVGTGTNPDFVAGTVLFQYGTSTAYGSQTPTQSIGPTTRARFTAAADGLARGTTYHFRMVVTNALGTAVGADQTFAVPAETTKPAVPISSPGPKGSPKGKGPTLKVKRLHGLSFRVSCAAAPCNGKLVATARAGKRKVVVAKAKLRIPAGATKKVTLAPTKKGKALIAAPGKLAVVVKATLGTKSATVPKPIRLKLG
jgi:hypothetical protein